MNPKKLENLLKLPPANRHTYFLGKAADQEAVWGLKDQSGWVMSSDDNGIEAFPVWPEEVLAQACATGEWNDAEPEKIDLSSFMDRWLKGLDRDGKNVAVFVTPSSKGVLSPPLRLRDELEEELKKFGGTGNLLS